MMNIQIVQIENGWVLVLKANMPGSARQLYFDSIAALSEALPFEVETTLASDVSKGKENIGA